VEDEALIERLTQVPKINSFTRSNIFLEGKKKFFYDWVLIV